MPNWRRIGILAAVGTALAVGGWFLLRGRNNDTQDSDVNGDTAPPNGEESEPDAGNLENRTGQARPAYDVTCFDQSGNELYIGRRFSGRDGIDYSPVDVLPGATYTCMAANPADDKALTARLEYSSVVAGRSPTYQRVRGQNFDEDEGRTTFSLVYDGTYRLTLGVGNRDGDGASDVKKNRVLAFTVGAVRDAGQAASLPVSDVAPLGAPLRTLPIERIGGPGR